MTQGTEREDTLDRFISHKVDEGQARSMEHVRSQCRTLAMVVLEHVPRGDDRKRALLLLEDVMHSAVKGISHERRDREETITS